MYPSLVSQTSFRCLLQENLVIGLSCFGAWYTGIYLSHVHIHDVTDRTYQSVTACCRSF